MSNILNPHRFAAGYDYDLDDDYGIDTTPLLHWDASTLEAVNSASDGSTFSTWTSREGDAHDLLQATGGTQFTYEATSSNMNSKPVAYSSDGARLMKTATNFLPAGTVTMPITIIMAICYDSVSATQTVFSGKDLTGSHNDWFEDFSPRSSDFYIYAATGGGTGGYLRGSSTNIATGAQIITWELNGASSNFYKELAKSTTVSGSASGNNPFNWQLIIGAQHNSATPILTDTEIAEFIVFNEVLSDTTVTSDTVDGGELHTIISYLKNKYGIS